MKFAPKLVLLLLSCLTCRLTAQEPEPTHNWPAFRGSDARGVGYGSTLPEQWSAEQNVSWKRETPGRGWSSPIVWDGQIVLTTVERDGEFKEPRKGLYFGGEQMTPPDVTQTWKVLSLKLDTGEPIWERTVHSGKPQSTIHIKNSYASETPVTDGERIYAYFGNVGIFCLDMNGQLLWEKLFPPRKTRLGWGPAASPAVHNGIVYIVNDNDESSWLVALDGRTGDEIWKIEREERSNWSTPFIWKNHLRTEIVTPGTMKSRAYDLKGNLLYEFNGLSAITIATPYAADGLLYVTSGYVMDRRRPIFAIRPGASGDISLGVKDTSNDFVVWCQKRAAPYNPSTLVYDGLLYVLYDQGLIACYDARTGEEVYGRQRLRDAGGFTASPWAYNGRVFCINETGRTWVIKAGRDYELLRTNRLADEDMAMACPAIADGKLLIRTKSRLYALSSKAAGAAD